MTIFIIVDGKEIWYTYDQPSTRELNRVTLGQTKIYSYNLINQTAQKYNGTIWTNQPLSNNSFTDAIEFRFYPNEQIFEYYNTKENKWLLIPRL